MKCLYTRTRERFALDAALVQPLCGTALSIYGKQEKKDQEEDGMRSKERNED
jgi:hypothetical protein